MAKQSEFWQSVVSGVVCTGMGGAIIVATMLAESEANFPAGRWPIYLLGGIFLAAGPAIALYRTRWADAALDGFITALLAICSAILLCVTWSGGGWSRGIPFLPDALNQFIGNAIGTLMGAGMGIAAVYRLGTAARGIDGRRLRKTR